MKFRAFYSDGREPRHKIMIEAPDHRVAAQQLFAQHPVSADRRITVEVTGWHFSHVERFQAAEFMDEVTRASLASPGPLRTATFAAAALVLVRPMDATANTNSSGPVYTMVGVQDRLEVYPDKVCITPKGVLGFMNKGLKGTKTIPYFSVSAVQFKEAGAVLSGYLQFTIAGGNESRGGLLAATKDENTFMFAKRQNNALAAEIKDYIERAVHAARTTSRQQSVSLADEVKKLADLRASGILTHAEFEAAKSRLLS